FSTFGALPKWARDRPSLCQGVAFLHVASAEALLKPVHSLLRTAVRKRLRIDMSGRHALQAVVAHCRRRIQALLHFSGIQQLSLIGRVSPPLALDQKHALVPASTASAGW